MAIIFNDNILNRSPKDINDKSGIFENGVWRPYNDIAEALASPKLIVSYRNVGLTIYILKNGSLTEYWWKDGIANDQLIEKIISGEYFQINGSNFESDNITYLNPQLAGNIFSVEYMGRSDGGGSFDRGMLIPNINFTILDEGGFTLIAPYTVEDQDIFQVSGVGFLPAESTGKQDLVEKNQPNGYAGLDGDGKISSELLPEIILVVQDLSDPQPDTVLSTEGLASEISAINDTLDELDEDITDTRNLITQDFTDFIAFDFDGSNLTHELSFTPKTISGNGVVLNGSNTLNPYFDFLFIDNTIVINNDVLPEPPIDSTIEVNLLVNYKY